jgi:hypothetical protein
VVARVHTPALRTLLTDLVPDASIPANGGDLVAYRDHSDPNLNNDIVFGNRSFYWANVDNPATTITETGLFPASCNSPAGGAGCAVNPTGFEAYTNDLAVLDGIVDTGGVMFVRYGLLTDDADNRAEYTGGSNLFTLGPLFANPVFNEGKSGLDIVEFTVLQTAGAFDEGGNFIQVAFGPLPTVELGSIPNQRVFYDYHIQAGSPAVSAGQNVGLSGLLGKDFDGDPRNNGNTNDIGADELP